MFLRLYPLHRWADAVDKAATEGFTVLRTWGLDTEHKRMFQAIKTKNATLDAASKLRVQVGIYFLPTNTGWKFEVDRVMRLLAEWENEIGISDILLSVSVGNEGELAGATNVFILETIQFAKLYGLPVTYNFSTSVLSQNMDATEHAAMQQIVQEVSYFSIHPYGNWFGSTAQSTLSVADQITAVKAEVTSAASFLTTHSAPSSLPLVLGEVGRQSTLRGGTHDDMNTFYSTLLTEFAAGNVGDGLIYFKLADAAWKGSDSGWGLYLQGDATGLGEKKTASNQVAPPPANELSVVTQPFVYQGTKFVGYGFAFSVLTRVTVTFSNVGDASSVSGVNPPANYWGEYHTETNITPVTVLPDFDHQYGAWTAGEIRIGWPENGVAPTIQSVVADPV